MAADSPSGTTLALARRLQQTPAGEALQVGAIIVICSLVHRCRACWLPLRGLPSFLLDARPIQSRIDGLEAAPRMPVTMVRTGERVQGWRSYQKTLLRCRVVQTRSDPF